MIPCIYNDTTIDIQDNHCSFLKQLKTLLGCIGSLYADIRLMTSCQICLPPYSFYPEHLAIIIPIHSCQQH